MSRRVSDQSTQSPLTKVMEQSFSALIRQCMFCLPGRVTGFDPDTQLAQIEWGINRVDEDGNALPTPVVDNVPVVFAGDGEWYFWHQITPGETEGLIHFSQRAIDTWIEQGGPATPHERRYLSEEDAFFTPGFRSKPGAIPNFKNDGAGISNYDQSVSVHLTSSGTEIENNATVNGDLSVTGDLSVDGDADITGDAVIGGISFLQHTHTQPADSAGDAESPTAPPQ